MPLDGGEGVRTTEAGVVEVPAADEVPTADNVPAPGDVTTGCAEFEGTAIEVEASPRDLL